MNKEEMVKLLVWAYDEGYKTAIETLKGAKVDSNLIQKMFLERLKESEEKISNNAKNN